MFNSRLSLLAILALTLLTTTSARPSKPQLSTRNSPNLSNFNVPLSDGSASLPSPTSTLKAIAVGRGTQNYTCNPPTTTTTNTTNTTPTPIAIGALATLFDASPLLTYMPPAAGLEILSLLPSYLINFSLSQMDSAPIPILGHHYFNSAAQPTFDLGSTGFLVAKKIGDIPAPAGACAGVMDQGFGAVDWLALTDAGGSRGVSEVFRVETAGGKAPTTCPPGGGMIEVQYSALYWFYG